MYDINKKVQYYAFISHKSCDSKFALKMQNFIESYNLPTEVKTAANSPKRLTPLCSYEVDFSANPLYDEMEAKLRQSHYLILICSEDLVKQGTKYVNYEIETFIRCKQEEGINPLTKIIPIIVSGEFADGEHDCRPEALKNLGDNCPIAIDRQKYKNDREVFLHTISALLDIDYAVIQNRDKKRQRRKKIAIAAVACIALVAAALLGEYYIPQKSHYVDFVMQGGLPVGIEKLSYFEYKKMGHHYVITKQQHKIVKLEYVNSEGNLDNVKNIPLPEARPAKYVFEYNGSQLSCVTYYNKNNMPYFMLQYSGGSQDAADIKNGFVSSEAFYINKGYESNFDSIFYDSNMNPPSGISRFVYEYSPENYVTKVTFHSDSSNSLKHDNEIYGFEYERDEIGRITAVYFLDASGGRRLNSQGIFCKRYTYDENNNISSLKCLDVKYNLTPDTNQASHMVYTYDDNHNKTSLSFYDENGSPQFIDSYNAATQLYVHDSNGRHIYTHCYDENNNLSSSLEFCSVRFEYDKNGYKSSQTYFDAENNPTTYSWAGYASALFENDHRGNALITCFCDENGNPINTADGYAIYQNDYDKYGRIISTSYFDADGNPTTFRNSGYSVKTTEYDNRGRETAICYFDTNKNPVNTSGPVETYFDFGYHKLETVYNYGANTKSTTTYYDTDNNPVNTLDSSYTPSYAKAVNYIQSGIITSSTLYYANGDVFTTMESEESYTPTAERIETIRIKDKDNNITQESVTTYSIEGIEKSKVTKEFSDRQIKTQMEIIFGENGVKETVINYEFDKDGAIIKTETTKYNPDGTKESITVN